MRWIKTIADKKYNMMTNNNLHAKCVNSQFTGREDLRLHTVDSAAGSSKQRAERGLS